MAQEARIHVLHAPATGEQVRDMLESLAHYIKVAVDVRRGVLAGGGFMHADCEAVLIEDGSAQEDVWGADWVPFDSMVTFESLINIRPNQGNPSLEIFDSKIRERVESIVRTLMGAS
jgi:hypothetical protein